MSGQVSWICSEASRDVPSFNLDFNDFNVDIGVVEIERVGEKSRREVKRGREGGRRLNGRSIELFICQHCGTKNSFYHHIYHHIYHHSNANT